MTEYTAAPARLVAAFGAVADGVSYRREEEARRAAANREG